MRFAPIAALLAIIGWAGYAAYEHAPVATADIPVIPPEYVRTPVHATTEDDLEAVRSAKIRMPTLVRWCPSECPAPGR